MSEFFTEIFSTLLLEINMIINRMDNINEAFQLLKGKSKNEPMVKKLSITNRISI
jgi:hypothetical protein